MSKPVPKELRAKIAQRAGFRYEYCRLPEEFALYPFEVDHIIALKHGGTTQADNLAYSCMRCNRLKGTDLTTILPDFAIPVPLFNPRKENWFAHFELSGGRIVGKTQTGKATTQLLGFNSPERVIGRQLLVEAGIYP